MRGMLLWPTWKRSPQPNVLNCLKSKELSHTHCFSHAFSPCLHERKDQQDLKHRRDFSRFIPIVGFPRPCMSSYFPSTAPLPRPSRCPSRWASGVILSTCRQPGWGNSSRKQSQAARSPTRWLLPPTDSCWQLAEAEGSPWQPPSEYKPFLGAGSMPAQRAYLYIPV